MGWGMPLVLAAAALALVLSLAGEGADSGPNGGKSLSLKQTSSGAPNCGLRRRLLLRWTVLQAACRAGGPASGAGAAQR